MDIDNDIDENLLQQFSCMNTTDRDVLIAQFQKLLGDRINSGTCTFFLDMNNWNLQEAVCAFFEFESTREHLPSMAFIRDVTVGDGEAIPPATKFIKTWKLQNNGEEPWPAGCSLKFTHGDRLSEQDQVILDCLPSLQCIHISVEMVSPEKSGIYQGQWRMCTPGGLYFGEIIWVIISVQEGGLLGVTQQMSLLTDIGSSPRHVNSPVSNPFRSPNCRFTESPAAETDLGSHHPSRETPINRRLDTLFNEKQCVLTDSDLEAKPEDSMMS